MNTDSQKTQDIINFMSSWGGYYKDWYVGITSDPTKRLFSDHCVNERVDAWIFRTYSSDLAARSAEDYFIKTLGTDGGPGGGTNPCACVYAYKKVSYTKP